jgi:peptide deformylase
MLGSLKMAERILQYGHPALRRKAEPVGKITPAVRQIAQRLAQSLRAHRGLGLAGPQIGEPVRAVFSPIDDMFLPRWVRA